MAIHFVIQANVKSIQTWESVQENQGPKGGSERLKVDNVVENSVPHNIGKQVVSEKGVGPHEGQMEKQQVSKGVPDIHRRGEKYFCRLTSTLSSQQEAENPKHPENPNERWAEEVLFNNVREEES